MHYHQNYEKIALNTYKNKVDLFVKSIAKIDKVCYHDKEYEILCLVVSVAGIFRIKDMDFKPSFLDKYLCLSRIYYDKKWE